MGLMGVMAAAFRRYHRRKARRALRLWFDEQYRLPMGESASGLETRRAVDAAWYLLHVGAVAQSELRKPRAATYAELALVHTADYLESLTRTETLAGLFALDVRDVVVDELLRTVRLACGGTIEAAREALAKGGTHLNLVGGFHHAFRSKGGGFCPLNDIAVAVAVLRAEGFSGRVSVIDLDAHPPDGTTDCLRHDEKVWIGSLSGSDWGKLEGADEVLLERGTGDREYLSALERLLGRMPRPQLAFVVAGGDVLAGDRLGLLGLSLEGVRRRDIRVAEVLDGTPSVWLPGGGYSSHAWKVLAGTGLAMAFGSRETIPRKYDPVLRRFTQISQSLEPALLGGGDSWLTEDDLADLMGGGRRGPPRLMGFYTREGLEYALHRYGLLSHLARLGYSQLRVEIDSTSTGRVRLLGTADRVEHALVELDLERRRIGDGTFLYINWLSLRHPRVRFSAHRPQLPGQDVPGLGLAREMNEMLMLMAKRLVLDGVAFRPAWYHIAYAGRHRARFMDPARQGRFEAMLRDFAGRPLLEVTTAVAEGRARMNGQPYTWEAEEMVDWIGRDDGAPRSDEAVVAERDRVHFELV